MADKCTHCKGTGLEPVNLLRTLRGKRKQGEIAAELGITQSAYSRLEGQAGHFYFKHARALADFYKVSIDVIYGRAPIPAAKPARPKKAPPAGAVAASRAHRESVKRQQQAKARGRRRA